MFQRTNRAIRIAAFAAWAASASSITLADAPAPSSNTLGDLLAQADLVFRGQVIDIEYVLSEPSEPGRSGVPFTFVTYEVFDLLHGEAGELVTLRFLGGYHHPSGLFLRTGRSPRFDIGDEDVLFVTGNNDRLAPLVGDRNGRFRVIDDQVYTDNGIAVEVTANGSILLGEQHLLEPVLTHDVMGRITVRGLGPDAIIGPSEAIAQGDFLQSIDRAAALAPTPAAAFVNADPAQPFDAPDVTVARMRESSGAEDQTSPSPLGNEGFLPAKRN